MRIEGVVSVTPLISTRAGLFYFSPKRGNVAKLLIALVAGIVQGLPWLIDAPILGIVAIMLGMYMVTRNHWGSSFWLTLIWTTLAIGIAFYWSPEAMAYTLNSGIVLGLVIALPLILWDGLRLALCYWLATRITKDLRWFWFPAALTTIAIEQFIPSVFPWRLGFTIMPWTWMIQAVDIFGAAWTTFIAFTLAGLIIQLIRLVAVRKQSDKGNQSDKAIVDSPSNTNRPNINRPVHWLAWSTVPIVAVNLIYSAATMQHWKSKIDSAPHKNIALVQVDPSFVESVGWARELTQSIVDQVDLVCWPESSGGNYDLALEDLNDELKVFEASRAPERGLRPWPQPKCELLLAGKNYIGDPEVPQTLYVTAMLIDKNEHITGRYNKRFLMPFGEYVPFENTIPGLAELFSMDEYMTPGDRANVIESQTGAKLGVMLCYEDMVPLASREMTLAGADVLISLINGSAFESKHTLKQHRLLSQLRALECRRTMLRCAATGETCMISALGDIESRIPLQERAVLVCDTPLLNGSTIASFCPWLTDVLCIVGLACFVFPAFARK